MNKLSIDKIRKAIPDRCFEKKPLLGIYYIVKDFLYWSLSFIVFYYFTD